MQINCHRCERRQEAEELVEIITSTGKRQIRGKCSVCGAKFSRFGRLPIEKLIPQVAVKAIKPKPVVLVPVGQPIRLGSLAAGNRFEVGGQFFILKSIKGFNLSVNKLGKNGVSIEEAYTMGTTTWVRQVQG